MTVGTESKCSLKLTALPIAPLSNASRKGARDTKNVHANAAEGNFVCETPFCVTLVSSL
jgi:hypothetical protein